MSFKNTIFYRCNKAVSIDFTADDISSDGSVILLEKIERSHRVIKYFSSLIPDYRDPRYIEHSLYKMLKQRVFMLMQGYEDCNDVSQLKTDPLFQDVLQGDMASQPTPVSYTHLTLPTIYSV